jgi:hypothetical protein
MEARTGVLFCGFLDRGEGFVEGGEHEVAVGGGEAHRGFDAEGVSFKSAFADEQAELAAFFENCRALGGGGFFGGAVFDQLDA